VQNWFEHANLPCVAWAVQPLKLMNLRNSPSIHALLPTQLQKRRAASSRITTTDLEWGGRLTLLQLAE
jgi:hypothetical protein